MDRNESFDAFFSYNSSDKLTVRRLKNALKKRDIKVWIDEEQLIPGRPWQESLEKIIQTCDTMLILIGKDGISPWQEREMRGCITEFVNRRKPAIPVLLPGTPKDLEMPFFLKHNTWVDLRNGLVKRDIDKIVWGITGVKP